MNYPEDIKYHKDDAWAKIEGGKAKIGITDFAQDALGDIVYLDMPEVGAEVKQDVEITEIESTKATSPVISPVNGKIVEVNTDLEDEPEAINAAPYDKGWIAIVELAEDSGADNLMDASAYGELKEEAE